MAHGSYLLLRGTTYHFRIRTPHQWRDLVGREQPTRSLRTGSKAQARHRSVRLLSLTEALWGALHPAMTPAEAKVLVDQWLTAKLEEDADHRDLPRRPVHDTVLFRQTEPWRPDEVAETMDAEAFYKRFTLRAGDPTLCRRVWAWAISSARRILLRGRSLS